MLTRFMLALLVLGAAFAPPAGAQPPGLPVESAADGTVEGLVTTADGRAVVGARVGLVGMAEPTATSDVDGRFRLANLPAGQYKLRVELEGFGRRERPVEVQAGATTRLRMTLPFLPFSETVTVTATRSER